MTMTTGMTGLAAAAGGVAIEALVFRHPGAEAALFDGFSARLVPGLNLVLGGDGAGKTTLLRLLAGACRPQAGRIVREAAGEGAGACAWCDPAEAGEGDLGATPARTFLDGQRARHRAGWREADLAAHLDGFALGPHLDKPLHALSAGTRRKLLLAASLASGAALTLIDDPFAALDRRSVAHLLDALDAQVDGPRVVVVAHAGEAADFDGLDAATVLRLPPRD